MMIPPVAVWFSTPNLWLLEVVAASSVGQILIDVEHGLFDLKAVDHFIRTAKALGLTVHAKTLAPEMSPVQQMLDFGADSVIIPHIEDVAHARTVCSYAKYPPFGNRSSAGGRTVMYRSAGDGHYDKQNQITRCYPMIETKAAYDDVEAILALDCVDGVFVGPTDLSLSCGRGRYSFSEADKAAITHIARAAQKAEKPWILPAWRPAEQDLAIEMSAHFIVLTEEQSIYTNGLDNSLNKFSARLGA